MTAPSRGELNDPTISALDELTRHQVELELQNAELRRMQLLLLASRGRYFDLYNRAPVGYVTLNEAGTIRNANLTAARLLGKTRRDLFKQPLTRFIVPDDQDIYYHHKNQLIATRARQVCEVRMLRSEGEPCWVRIEATAAQSASGAVVYRAVVSDISARRRAEVTLRASEERHRSLFEKSHDALMTLAPPDWRLTAANSTTLAMFGAPDEKDFLSRSVLAYSPRAQLDGSISAEKVLVMVASALNTGSHFFEWTFRRLSGHEFPATVLLTRMEIDGQALLHATVRDETEVKRLQALLRQSDRLTSMGTLAAGVAHEINNPLTYVLHNLESLSEDLPKLAGALARTLQALRTELGSERLTCLLGLDGPMLEPEVLGDMADRAQEALDGTERINAISRAIGTFSRVESNERFRVDLNHAIECAAAMAMTVVKVRAKLVVDYGKLPSIWASAGKLSQVFLNLLINAAHAIDEGNALQNHIRIRTWASGEDVFAEIEDTGKGISAANLPRIFEPFYTTKSVGVGSGLGLPICHNIVSEFGGDIKVDSELGKGSRFTVRFPVNPGASPAPPPRVVFPAREPADVHGRLLVIDDEQPILAMLTQLLGSEHEIVTASSGEAGQAVLRNDQSFDVIICDLMMPGLTGMDLHAWLAVERPELARRVVFLTGGAFTPLATEYVTRVGNLRIEKPYEKWALKQLVSELVGAARGSSGRGASI